MGLMSAQLRCKNIKYLWVVGLVLSLLVNPSTQQDIEDDIFGCKKANLQPDGTTCLYRGSRFFTDDTAYVNDDIKVLIFSDEAHIECIKEYSYGCTLRITLTQPDSAIVIRRDSYLSADAVVIDSPNTRLLIDATSYISSSNSGDTRGTDGDHPQRGADMVGEGGRCDGGDFGQLYDTFDADVGGNRGSMGNTRDKRTQGGGQVHINVEALLTRGRFPEATIFANGQPSGNTLQDTEGKMGGSGGHIQISTINKNYSNEIDDETLIQANGGNGAVSGFGGAGGVIRLDGDFDQRHGDFDLAQAYGGLPGHKVPEENKACGTGAAGTVWLKKTDMLMISNGGRKTARNTYLDMRQRDNAWPSDLTIAKDITIEQGAAVTAKVERDGDEVEVLFPSLRIEDDSGMRFWLVRGNPRLVIKYDDQIKLDRNSYLETKDARDLLKIRNQNATKLANLELGKVEFRGTFEIEAGQLYLLNELKNEDAQNGNIEFVADRIVVMDNVTLKAARVFLYGQESVELLNNVSVNSLVERSCTTGGAEGCWMAQCMSEEYKQPALTKEGIISYVNQKYNMNAQNVHDLKDHFFATWQVYIMSPGTIKMKDSKVTAPRIGLCGTHIDLHQSSIDTSWKGCSRDNGLGYAGEKRVGSLRCAGAGASHGGAGGSGGITSVNDNDKNECKAYFKAPYYFGKEALYEGSGGVSGDQDKRTGGAGGGIVWVLTPGNLTLSGGSEIRAAGQAGQLLDLSQAGSGGGSGGSIFITALNMRGNGVVSLKGGAGSDRGGGGGAGGRLIMNYLRAYQRSSYPAMSYDWTGELDIDGGDPGDIAESYGQGSKGEAGSAVHTRCFPGYSGVFCKACEPGFYKYDYGFGQCLPCKNKPYYSTYVNRAQNSSICDYECNQFFENSKTNPDCLDPVSLQVQRMGGTIPFFGLLGIFMLISVLVFACLSYRAGQINEELKELPENIYRLWDGETDFSALRGKCEIPTDMSMNDADVWSHTHRMYLIGSNSIKYPWFIPKDFPRDALKKEHRETFLKFIDEINTQLHFSACERYLFYFLSLLYPPGAESYHLRVRKSKFAFIQSELAQQFTPQFFADNRNNKSLRFSCSKSDYQMAYIDFLDFSVTKANWQGVKLPQAILLAGNGTFNNPYSLDYKEDTFAKSIALVKLDFFKDKLPMFLENFNSDLSKLSFYKLQIQVMRDLGNVVDWLEKANRSMFNHFNMKCVLYIIENQYSPLDTEGFFKQKRRSFPLESVFFTAFPEMYQSLLSYIKDRLVSNKSEIRMALVFKPFTMTKAIKTEMRVNLLTDSSNKKGAYRLAVNREESVLFDETDKDNEDQTVRFDKSVTEAKKSLESSQESTATLTSSVNLLYDGNTKKKSVKLVEKTKRAFSISIESSKAFELAIRKPRTACKHYVTSIRAFIYSIYLLLMKQSGSPPNSKDLTNFFILYSGLLALDAMFLINYILHMLFPLNNFIRFGWAFLAYVFMVPLVSPIISFIAAFKGDARLMKVSNNMNSMTIMVNIPFACVVSYFQGEDPVFFLLFAFIILVKMGLSATSSKVRQYLSNPRFQKNNQKLRKILWKQNRKMLKREEILGRDTIQQLNAEQQDLSLLEKEGINNPISYEAMEVNEKLRDKLLE